jgi:hypothetical protein
MEQHNYDQSTSLKQMKNRYAPDFTPPRPDDADDRVGGCAKGCHRCCTAPQSRGAADVGGWSAGRVDKRRVIAARLPIYVVQAEAFKTPIW